MSMEAFGHPTASFGIFDHLDHAGGSLRQQYSDRLKIAAACDEAGFLTYHVAEHHGHATWYSGFTEPVPIGRGSTDQKAPAWTVGDVVESVSSAAGFRRDLHA